MYNTICVVICCLLIACAAYILLWFLPRALTTIVTLLAMQMRHMEIRDGKKITSGETLEVREKE